MNARTIVDLLRGEAEATARFWEEPGEARLLLQRRGYELQRLLREHG